MVKFMYYPSLPHNLLTMGWLRFLASNKALMLQRHTFYQSKLKRNVTYYLEVRNGNAPLSS